MLTATGTHHNWGPRGPTLVADAIHRWTNTYDKFMKPREDVSCIFLGHHRSATVLGKIVAMITVSKWEFREASSFTTRAACVGIIGRGRGGCQRAHNGVVALLLERHVAS